MPGELSQLVTIETGLELQGRTARVATVLMYLNDDTALVGGETAFPQVGTLYSVGSLLLSDHLQTQGMLDGVSHLPATVRMAWRH